MIKSLTIIHGIIQDKKIGGIPIKLAIVQPRGKANVRTLIKMKEVIGITNHNTANTEKQLLLRFARTGTMKRRRKMRRS